MFSAENLRLNKFASQCSCIQFCVHFALILRLIRLQLQTNYRNMSQIVCDEACQLVKQRHAALTSQIGAAQSQLAQLQQTHGSNSQVAASLQKVIQGLIQQRQIVAQQAKDLYDRLDAVKKEASGNKE